MIKIGYVRVSSGSQNPAGQIQLMIESGIDKDLIFVDDAVSGTIDPMKRPIFKKMVDLIDKGGCQELVFSEFSRIGRTVDSSLMTLLRLKEKGITITSLSPSECFINKLPGDLQTWMISGMMFAASMERKHNNERVRYGFEYAKIHGTRSGRPIGRPKIVIDWNKIEETKKKYNVSENCARKIVGYSATVFYAAKKKMKNTESPKT